MDGPFVMAIKCGIFIIFNLSLKPVWPSLVPFFHLDELNVATEERSNRTFKEFLNFIKKLRNDGAYFE